MRWYYILIGCVFLNTTVMNAHDLVEEDEQELLLIFSSVVSCFANILKDPNNPRNLALNLTGIATGVLNILLNTMSCKYHPSLIQQITKLKTLTTQRFL